MARLRRKLLPFENDNVRSFIDELGLIPTCLITPSLADAYERELSYRLYAEKSDRAISDIERELVNDAYAYMMKRNNNRLHIWRKADFLYPQLQFENFD